MRKPKNTGESNMTKAELIEKIRAKSGLETKAGAEKALDAVLDSISECLAAGDSLTIVGFGSFKVAERKARTGRNPRTNEPMPLPAAKVVKFVPGKGLKDKVN